MFRPLHSWFICSYLRSRELEYVHDVNDVWRIDRFWLFSSYKRVHVYDISLWHLVCGVSVADLHYGCYPIHCPP